MPRVRLALGLALACTPPAPAGDAAPAAAPPPAIVSPRPTAPAPAIAAPTTPAATAPAPAPAFQLAAYRDGELSLHLLGDDLFLGAAAYLAHAAPDGHLVPVEHNLAGQHFPADFFEAWSVLTLGGRWPDDAWLVTETVQSRLGSPPHVHRRDRDRWVRLPNKQGVLHWYYTAIVPWLEGQVLGLREVTVAETEYDDAPPDFDERIERQTAAAFRGFDLLGATPRRTTMVVDPDLRDLRDVAAAPTGELFLLAGADYRADGPARVQRWGLTGPAATRGAVDVLPDDAAMRTLVVRAADDATIGGHRTSGPRHRALLLHYDGATWTETPAPPGHEVVRLALAPDGALWAIVRHLAYEPGDAARTRLYRRTTADWLPVDLPDLRFPDLAAPRWTIEHGGRPRLRPADPDAAAKLWTLDAEDLVVRAPDDLWILAHTPFRDAGVVASKPVDLASVGILRDSDDVFVRRVLLRTKPGGPALAIPTDAELALDALDSRPARPWSPRGCPEDQPAFVALRTLPQDAPPADSEPKLEAFLHDNPALHPMLDSLFEVHDRGRRTIGLFVRPPDRPAADALLAALERAVPGEPRKLECRRPRPLRAFDLHTGRTPEPAATP